MSSLEAHQARLGHQLDPGMGADERLIQLRTCATNYVYQGTTEHRAGRVDLSGDPGLEKVYDADGVTVYRVKGERVRAASPLPPPTPRRRS